MPKFRKKPVVIEAYQTLEPMEIETLEGTMRAESRDWIITGVQGEQYPCKPDIFAATYEPAERQQVTDEMVERAMMARPIASNATAERRRKHLRHVLTLALTDTGGE